MDILYVSRLLQPLPEAVHGRLGLAAAGRPDGNAYPCLAAHELPLPQANVREHDLRWIWESSPMFSAFRGTDWMPDPCASCDRREIDLGGCRCQAFQLTGEASRTDPVCVPSLDRHLIDEAIETANSEDGPGLAGGGVRAGARAPAPAPAAPRRLAGPPITRS